MPRLRVSDPPRPTPRPRWEPPAILLCGAALTLAFPEADLAPTAWVALVPLLVALRAVRLRRAIAYGALFGLGFYGSLLVWVSHVGWLGWTVLVIVQASYLALFAGLSSALARRAPALLFAVGIPSMWVFADFLRSIFPVGGFTWGQLAQSQTVIAYLLRPAAVGGAWLITWLVVAINAQLALAWARRSPLPRAAIAAALVLVPLVLPAPRVEGRAIDVAIVQGNVPRDPRLSGSEKLIRIAEDHAAETAEVPEGIDLVVWPESALGLDIDEVPEMRELLEAAAGDVDAPMIVGGEVDEGPQHRRVVAFEVSPDGTITDTYIKTHLVPFGEYVPARSLLDWIPALEQVPRDALAGDERTIFEVPGGRIAPVISFEGDFGSLVRRRIDEGGRMLVVATNTSTWGNSWASAQHVAFSRLRAVENGVWVLHAAISGISAFIAPDGEVEKRTQLWTRTHIEHKVRFATSITPYARFGDWVPLLSGLIAIFSLVFVVIGIQRRK
jgi:apolipoprotein N-acyltransferase